MSELNIANKPGHHPLDLERFVVSSSSDVATTLTVHIGVPEIHDWIIWNPIHNRLNGLVEGNIYYFGNYVFFHQIGWGFNLKHLPETNPLMG